MNTKTVALIGGGLLALGGLAWWNRYVILVVTSDITGVKPSFTAVRMYAFTEEGARTSAALASTTAKVGQTVYITQRQRVRAVYNVGTPDENKGADEDTMTAQARAFGLPLAGLR